MEAPYTQLMLLLLLLPSTQLSAAYSNPLIDYKQCSHGDEEWHICLDSRIRYFCPSTPRYNFSQMVKKHESYIESLEGEYPNFDCFTCSNVDSGCETFVHNFFQARNISQDDRPEDYLKLLDDYFDEQFFEERLPPTTTYDEMLDSCRLLCEGGKATEACSPEYPCTPGSHFCDYNSDEDVARNNPGICKACPQDLNECFEDGFVSSKQSTVNCHGCIMDCYNAIGEASVTTSTRGFKVTSDEMLIQKSSEDISGQLIDCTNLLYANEFICPGAEGRVCLLDGSSIKIDEQSRGLWDIYKAASSNGCIAMIASNMWFNVDYETLPIPFLTLIENENLLDLLGQNARVRTQIVGTVCLPSSDITDCTSSGLDCGDNEYCRFLEVKVEGKYTEGYCTECPTFKDGEPNPSGCFFSQFSKSEPENWSLMYNPEMVRSCAISCEASLGKLMLLVLFFAGDDILLSTTCSTSSCF